MLALVLGLFAAACGIHPNNYSAFDSNGCDVEQNHGTANRFGDVEQEGEIAWAEVRWPGEIQDCISTTLCLDYVNHTAAGNVNGQQCFEIDPGTPYTMTVDPASGTITTIDSNITTFHLGGFGLPLVTECKYHDANAVNGPNCDPGVPA